MQEPVVEDRNVVVLENNVKNKTTKNVNSFIPGGRSFVDATIFVNCPPNVPMHAYTA
jgi:hypothetical protein